MKRFFLCLAMGLLLPILLSAQNPQLNPLNYSGKMYISSMEVITTPRYVSYGDHALLNTELTVPMVKVSSIEFDFKNNTITFLIDPQRQIKVENVVAKLHTEGLVEVVVISMENSENASTMELVWSPFDAPYLLEIAQGDDEVNIVKYQLSRAPATSSPEEALMQLLYGIF